MSSGTTTKSGDDLLRPLVVVVLCFAAMFVGCGSDIETAKSDVEAAKATARAGVGDDLRAPKRASKSHLIAALETLTGMDLETNPFTIHPWRLESYAVGEVGWVLLEIYEGLDVPDMSAARVHAFDVNWNHLFARAFPTGYRHRVVGAQIQAESVCGVPLIRITVTSTGPFVIVPAGDPVPAFSTPGHIHQLYAVRHDRVVLMRLENHEHLAMGPSYAWSAPTMGPKIRSRTPDQLARSLESEDPIDVLETLLWLSGHHLTSSEPRRANINQESIEHSKLFELVHGRADVRDRLEMLKHSENPWIRDYAELSLRER